MNHTAKPYCRVEEQNPLRPCAWGGGGGGGETKHLRACTMCSNAALVAIVTERVQSVTGSVA